MDVAHKAVALVLPVAAFKVLLASVAAAVESFRAVETRRTSSRSNNAVSACFFDNRFDITHLLSPPFPMRPAGLLGH